MPENDAGNPIHIKKYPNRRYYDTFHSRHVTLQEVHDFVVSGRDVTVTDSRSGEDITNVVLMQILLEKDQPKLDLFPSSILHTMIRSNRQALRNTVERFFGPFLGLMAASQKQFDAYLRKSMKSSMMSPMDWAGNMFQAFGGVGESNVSESVNEPGTSDGTKEPNETRPGEDSIDELRSQIDALRQRIEKMGDDQDGDKN